MTQLVLMSLTILDTPKRLLWLSKMGKETITGQDSDQTRSTASLRNSEHHISKRRLYCSRFLCYNIGVAVEFRSSADKRGVPREDAL